ncbi:unnamed protein product [Sphagnum jensenii]|uniref:Uncharacterized protein n=1 Tax=Sphagnum jensenii TaxID=128206 RepID=A0ABP0WRT3_9BRYO
MCTLQVTVIDCGPCSSPWIYIHLSCMWICAIKPLIMRRREKMMSKYILPSLIHSQASKSCCHCTWCILMLQHIQG